MESSVVIKKDGGTLYANVEIFPMHIKWEKSTYRRICIICSFLCNKGENKPVYPFCLYVHTETLKSLHIKTSNNLHVGGKG